MVNKENYRNLMDSELQRYFKEYSNKTGKTANWGLHITKEFKNFLKNHEKIPNKVKEKLLEKTAEINKNNEIENFIKYQIKSSNRSQNNIAKIVREMYFKISADTVKRIALKKVFNNNLEKYEERFPVIEKTPEEIKEGVKNNILSSEPGTLKDIAKNYDISSNIVSKIAREILTPEEYSDKFPALKDKIPEEIKESIKNDILSNESGTLTDIAKKYDVSHSLVRNIAHENLTSEEYKEKFPTSEKISEEIKESIRTYIKSDEPDTLKDIAKKFNVSPQTVGRIARETLSSEEYKEKFHIYERITEEIKESIKKDIMSKEFNSLINIAKKVNVSSHTVGKIARAILTPDEYKEKFPAYEKILEEKKESIRKDIISDEPGTLKDLAKKHDISPSSIKRIAQESLTSEEYKEKFPASQEKITKEMKESIRKDIMSDKPDTLTDIGRKYDLSRDAVKKIAQESLTLDQYKKKFPASFDRIPEEIKESIKAEIESDKPGTLTDIAKKYKISHNSVRNMAQEILTPEKYKETFQTIDRIPEKVRGSIKAEIKSDKSGTLRNIANKYKVSEQSVSRIAKGNLTLEQYKEKFPQDIPAEIGTITHKCINDLVTKDFDKRRKNSPDVPKIISEPRIYHPLSEKHADMGFANNMKYLQELLANPTNGNLIARELGMDPRKLDHIKFTQFDYTNWLIEKNIISKIEKYQHPEIMTFIVGTKWDNRWKGRTKELPVDERIKYPENIKIISDDCFADLMDIKGINKENLQEIIELNKIGDLEGLKEINEKSEQKLHNTDELIEDLKKEGYIKKDISEYIHNIENNKQPEGTLDQFIYNEKNIKEQKEDKVLEDVLDEIKVQKEDKEFEGVLDEIKEQKEENEFEGVLDEINEEKEDVKNEDVSDGDIEDGEEDEYLSDGDVKDRGEDDGEDVSDNNYENY